MPGTLLLGSGEIRNKMTKSGPQPQEIYIPVGVTQGKNIIVQGHIATSSIMKSNSAKVIE